MRILLVRPPNYNSIQSNIPNFVEENSGIYPPLGLLYIAANLKKYTDVKIKILDAQLEKLNYKQIEEKIKTFNPDVVGVQVLTFTLLDALAIAQITKKINKNIIIIFGGRHASIYPNETINLPNVDYLIRGEGEFVFIDFIKNINNKENLKQVNGLVYKEKGNIINNGIAIIENLDKLPFPARELIDYKKYRCLLSKNPIFTTMITGRGCHFSCIFCDEGRKKFRAHSAEYVVKEMEECIKLGIKDIFICDSTFTIDKQRALEICDLIIKKKLNLKLEIRTRLDLIDEELLKRLKKAGCIRIQYGVESGSNRILNLMNKKISVDQIYDTIKLTKKIGFEVLCDFMIGTIDETKSEIMDTIDLAKKLPINYAQFAITTPYPDTELYQSAIKKGIFPDYWREFAKNPTKDFKVKLWSDISENELLQLLKYAYKSFYRRPSYVIKELLNVKSATELKLKIKAGIKI